MKKELVLPQYAVSIKKIRRIRAYTSLKTTKEQVQYAVSRYINTPYTRILYMKILEDIKRGPYSNKSPIRCNLTVSQLTEEYIRLEEEKACRHGKVYNWETAKYGKIWYDEDVHDLRSVETEFPAIVFNDELSSEKILSCKPTISSLNDNKIDFRISFDESDDEDYTNNNDKVNMPSFPSPEPTVSYFNDLDYFKDIEKEFPAIVYNDALTSKLDFLTEPTVSPQHDEFDLKDETSLSECDE
ncbi:hypothetical protein Tco_1054104 [Tanacetum coccineum]|uniref:Uncharacterized protein n=1 Tax=Tanacetum coccineum TaxID=301880 RepID=A0ABQ5GXZ0_9ASTR